MGDFSNKCGTFDHLVLLLARIAHFSQRDRRRKIRAQKSASASHSGLNTPTMPMYGMAPAPPNAPCMPQVYARGNNGSPQASPSIDSFDLDTAMDTALAEWSQVDLALNMFASRLGPQFQALPANLMPQVESSPFGAPLCYRSHDTAVLWAIYYMARIIAIRSHPSMPAAAIIAAGVAASATTPSAILIGRIASGIDKNATLALVEVAMPLFFAGVQYFDPLQRAWLINHLTAVEAHSGWASVGLIASGCETMWRKAAEVGRGPPYERVRDLTHDLAVPMSPKGSLEQHMKLRQASRSPDIDGRLAPAEADRRFIHANASLRVHWAIGVIGLEEDVERLHITS